MVDKVTEHKQTLDNAYKLADDLQEGLRTLHSQLIGADEDDVSEDPLTLRLQTTISDLEELKTMLETASNI